MMDRYSKATGYRFLLASICFGALTLLMVHQYATAPGPGKSYTFYMQFEEPNYDE